MKTKNIIIITIIIIITYNMFIYNEEVIKSIISGLEIWKNNILPSILPFFIISSILINHGFVDITKELFKPLMYLFGIHPNASFIFILSILSGFPSSSKYVKDLYNKKLIDNDTASKALMFTHFSNPLFIINTLSIYLNKKYAYIVLFSHYISNIIIGLIFKNYKNTYQKTNVNILESLNKLDNYKDNIGITLSNAIKDAIKTLLLILGTIVTFSFIAKIITLTFNLNNYTSAIITSILEVSNGLKYISLLNMPLKYKAILSTFALSFGSISIHTQIYTIISDTDIKYKPYLKARLIHMIISSIITFILTI